MKLDKILQKSYTLALALVLGGAVLVPSGEVKSQDATSLPVLSMTGRDAGYNSYWYPDGRLTTTPSKNAEDLSEILVPVFIKYAGTNETNGIFTFDVTLKYDSRMFEPVGVQSFNPNIDDPKYTNNGMEEAYKTVGSDFQFQYQTFEDKTYLNWLGIDDPNGDNMYGKAVRIVGSSSQKLSKTINERTNLAEFRPFFYVKMQVKPVYEVNTSLLNKYTYILLDADNISFNDIKTIGAPYYNNVAGEDMNTENPLWNIEPIRKGALMARILDNYPAFDFNMHQIVSDPIRMVSEDDGNGIEFELVDPITVDLGRTKDLATTGTRLVQLLNSQIGTRMSGVTIESDQPWLRTSLADGFDHDFDFDLGEKAYIPYIDNGILGVIYDPTDAAEITEAQDEIWLNIDCDPTLITPKAGETEGTYVGYLTFKSKDAKINPVRLKVTFIVLRPAYEPDLYPDEITDGRTPSHTGIRVNVSSVDGSESKSLVFGVAPRATAGIDTLMGERAYIEPMTTTGFDARWYPYPTSPLRETIANGFRDALPDYNRPDYNSRDIRDINDTTGSIGYLCEFNTPEYPIVISWNPSDFPEGAILYLKDFETDGEKIRLNMREGTPITNTGLLGYTLTDASLNKFVIEYTLPKVFNFVNESGTPIIEKGWNMLSLPVRPSNPSVASVFPNSLNRNALIFFPSGWEQTEQDLTPGQGFFIKYENVIDRSFSGSQITGIATEFGDKVRVFNGWNLIGGLSTPTSVNNISFDERDPSYPTPELAYTREYSYWGYRTDRGYYEVNELLPGLGYFIKVGRYDETGNGIEAYLRITRNAAGKAAVAVNPKEEVYAASTKLTVNDNAQKSASIYLADASVNADRYEIPPFMGGNFFDVRFDNNANLSNTEKSTINLNGVDYPVALSANNADADLFFYDAVSNELLGTITKNSGKTVEVQSTVANKINVVKGSVEFTAFPNPVTNTARVNYTVPEEGMVTVKLYDALGNEVAELVNSYLNAASYSVDFNAANLTSGAYMLKMSVGSYSAVTPVSIVK